MKFRFQNCLYAVAAMEIFLLSACSLEQESSLREAGVESEDVAQPVEITGSNLVDFDNARARCGFVPGKDLQFTLKCQTFLIDKNANEKVGHLLAEGLQIEWLEPKADTDNIKSISCGRGLNSLKFDCDVELSVFKTTTFEVKMNVKKNKLSRVEKDFVVLPYSITSYGIVPEIMRGFMQIKKEDDSNSSTHMNVADEKSQSPDKAGFQIQTFSLEDFKSYGWTDIEGSVRCNDDDFEAAYGVIYKIKDGKVSLYAGSNISRNKKELTHRLRLYLGKIVKLMCINNRELQVQSPYGIYKIFPDKNEVELMYDKSLPFSIVHSQSDGLKLYGISKSEVQVLDLKTQQIKTLGTFLNRDDTCGGALCATPLVWYPNVFYTLQSINHSSAHLGFFFTSPEEHNVKFASYLGESEIKVARDLSAYSWEGSQSRGKKLCYPDDVIWHNGLLYVRDYGNARILEIDTTAKKIKVAKQSIAATPDNWSCSPGDRFPEYYELYTTLKEYLGLEAQPQILNTDNRDNRPIDHFGYMRFPVFQKNGDILFWERGLKTIHEKKIQNYSVKDFAKDASYLFKGSDGQIYYHSDNKFFRHNDNGTATHIAGGGLIREAKTGVDARELDFYQSICLAIDADENGAAFIYCQYPDRIFKINIEHKLEPYVGFGPNFPVDISEAENNMYPFESKFKVLENGDMLYATYPRDFQSSSRLTILRYSPSQRTTTVLYDAKLTGEENIVTVLYVSKNGDFYVRRGTSFDIKKMTIVDGILKFEDTVWNSHENVECGSNVIIEGKTTEESLNMNMQADLSKICIGEPISMDLRDNCATSGGKREWLIQHSFNSGMRSMLVHIEEPCGFTKK